MPKKGITRSEAKLLELQQTQRAARKEVVAKDRRDRASRHQQATLNDQPSAAEVSGATEAWRPDAPDGGDQVDDKIEDETTREGSFSPEKDKHATTERVKDGERRNAKRRRKGREANRE